MSIQLRTGGSALLVCALVLIVCLVSTPAVVPVGGQTTAGNDTTAPNGSYPAGYAASGVTDPARAANGSARALANQESFTRTVNRTSASNRTTRTASALERVDTSSRTAYINVTGGNALATITSERYYADGKVYQRTNSPLRNETRYAVTRQPFDAVFNATNVTEVGYQQYLANANYGSAERVERNGTVFYRYNASELTDPGAFLSGQPGALSRENVSAFDGSVLVGQDGLIRELTYSATYSVDGTQRTRTLDLRTSAFNTTNVGSPEWLAAAKANASASNTTGQQAGNSNTDQQASAETAALGVTTTGETRGDSPMSDEITDALGATTAGETPTTPTAGDRETTTTGSDTTTATGTATADAATTADTATAGTTTGSGPGFGVALAVAALLAVGSLARRRR